jgi:hypothetical protein
LVLGGRVWSIEFALPWIGDTMKASIVIEHLQRMVREHGDVNVEIETDMEIVAACGIRYEVTDAPRGDSIIIQGTN